MNRPLLLTATLTGAALLFGCSVSETVNAVSSTTTTTETTTTTASDTSTPPDNTPPKRTVEVRNPLAGPAGNLLLDGDFELSTSHGPGQYGWRAFNSAGTGEVRMFLETGGLCRSGLTCAKFHKGELLLGRGTAAAHGKGHMVEMWGKMPEGVGCAKVSLILVTCDTFTVLKKATVDKDPEGGWCHHHATLPPSDVSLCFYLQNFLGDADEAVLDSAVLAPNDGTVPFKMQEETNEPVDAETSSRLQTLRGTVLRTMPFGKAPDVGLSRPD
ncbi:MAG: hypothetical protein U0441_37340 [Polyangiaceae bacterium]